MSENLRSPNVVVGDVHSTHGTTMKDVGGVHWVSESGQWLGMNEDERKAMNKIMDKLSIKEIDIDSIICAEVSNLSKDPKKHKRVDNNPIGKPHLELRTWTRIDPKAKQFLVHAKGGPM